jgi:hypothetical protein
VDPVDPDPVDPDPDSDPDPQHWQILILFLTGFSLCCEYREEYCDPACGQAEGRTVHGLWTLGRLRLFRVSNSKVQYRYFVKQGLKINLFPGLKAVLQIRNISIPVRIWIRTRGSLSLTGSESCYFRQ